MHVEELSEAEQVVLLALVGLTARADGTVSEPELEALGELRVEIGAERFEKVRDAAAKLGDGDAILKAAARVERPEARAVIFDRILDVAAPDTVAESEAELLAKLAALWNLESPF
jgi:hypothetical protein